MTPWFAGAILWFVLLALATPGTAQESPAAPCAACHEQKVAGVHAPVACGTCHAKHEEFPHPNGLPKPACASCHEQVAKQDAAGVHGRALKEDRGGPDCAFCHGPAHTVLQPKAAEFRGRMAETCGTCHAQPAAEYQSSVHGRAAARGLAEAPLCTDCHGAHSIQLHTNISSPVSPRQIRETCGSCHADVRLSRRFGLPADRLVSYDASFHGLAAKTGSQTVANCASCHGVHNILESSDPKSMIHAKNLPATCGQCHPGAGQRFSIGPVHVSEGHAEATAVRWVRGLYFLLIPLVIGLMVLHNFGDWLRKLLRLRLGRAAAAAPALAQAGAVRMLPFERLQHILLVLSFTVLVWTGFALKYPDQWWAQPLLAWERWWQVRSVVHRASGVLFIVVAALHVASLALSVRLRNHWKSLIPVRRDVTEGMRQFAFNLGLVSRPPVLSSHSYVEKAEYWAVVWGAAVMILTGWMLWANNLMLTWLPKWALDVAVAVHFYEAVLATLAIVVWHFYFVIFDPDVYPMDTAWMTGKSARHREGQ